MEEAAKDMGYLQNNATCRKNRTSNLWRGAFPPNMVSCRLLLLQVFATCKHDEFRREIHHQRLPITMCRTPCGWQKRPRRAAASRTRNSQHRILPHPNPNPSFISSLPPWPWSSATMPSGYSINRTRTAYQKARHARRVSLWSGDMRSMIKFHNIHVDARSAAINTTSTQPNQPTTTLER